jgi:hypothetical protein
VISSRRLYETTGQILIWFITNRTRLRPVIVVELISLYSESRGKIQGKFQAFVAETVKIIVIWNVALRVYVDEYKCTQRRNLGK